MDLGFINIKKTTKYFFRIRYIIPIGSIILSILLYHFIVNFYDPGINLLNRIRIGPNKYVLYIGEEGGFYFRLGNYIDKNTDLNVTYKKTHGGLENAVRVMTAKKAFGFVQENTIRQDDFLYERLQWLVPLYMEHMHVLYRSDRLGTKINEKPMILSEHMRGDLIKFLEGAKIGTGPIGSGTKEIARYILSVLPINRQEGFHNYSMVEAYNKLVSGEMDMIFVVAGAPIPEIYELIKQDNIKLMGIDPLLINKIQDEFGVTYRQTSFLNKYFFNESQDVVTLGAYSFLVASKDVSQETGSRIVHSIFDQEKRQDFEDELRNELAEKGMRFDEVKQLSLQLEEFAMPIDIQNERDREYIGDFFRDLILFITAVGASSIMISLILIYVISNFKISRYFTQISAIYNQRMPYSLAVQKIKDRFRPKPIDFETSESASIVLGLQELFDLRRNLRADYDTGGITERDYNVLCSKIDKTNDEFQSNLFSSFWYEITQRTEVDLGKKEGKNYWLTIFREYFSYGFLRKEDFFKLRELVQNIR